MIADMHGTLTGLALDKANYKTRKSGVVAGMVDKLTQLHHFVEKYGGNFLTGNIPRVPDF